VERQCVIYPVLVADDDEYGQFFYSKHFPNLKYFIHIGHEKEMGTALWCTVCCSELL
jgi:hypothetical protein